MADESREKLLKSLKSLRLSGDYTDLDVVCEDKVFHVHKAVVCPRSEFFANAVKFGGKETAEGKVTLEDGPATVELLVQYFYEAEYQPVLSEPWPKLPVVNQNTPRQKHQHTCAKNPGNHDCECYSQYREVCLHHRCGNDCDYNCVNFICSACLPTVTGCADQLLVHAKMYEIGDKYSVIGLKELAREKFKCACAQFWNDTSFSIAVEYAFRTTIDDDLGLREVVYDTISAHPELVKKKDIADFMTAYGAVGVAVLKEKLKQGTI